MYSTRGITDVPILVETYISAALAGSYLLDCLDLVHRFQGVSFPCPSGQDVLRFIVGCVPAVMNARKQYSGQWEYEGRI